MLKCLMLGGATVLLLLRVGLAVHQENAENNFITYANHDGRKEDDYKMWREEDIVYLPTDTSPRTELQQHQILHNSSLEPHKRQKRFIFTAIAIGVGLHIMNKKAAKRAAEQYERQMRFRLEDLCRQICVEQWQTWSSCSKPCGGGQRERKRTTGKPGKCNTLKDFTCPHHTREEELCNEGCPNGGSASNVGCDCVPGWTGRCCTQEVRCRYPGKPRNGQVFGTWPARYSAVATFTCEDGFYLDGQEMTECLNTGEWSNTQVPKCERIRCTMPPEGEHVRILNRRVDYVFGEQVVYECEEGYVLAGPEVRTCIKDTGAKGRWTGFQPRCKAVQCGDPGILDHGDRNGTSYKYNDVVTFWCDRGYQLLGSSKLKCMANGRWLGRSPQCVQIKCEPPMVPRHGSARLSRKSTLGSLVLFTCDPGYVIQGNSALQCMADGSWNATEPVCKAALCDDPGIPDHGSKDGSLYYYPHKVTYKCQNGYVREGAKEITCQSDGKWNAAKPICRPCPEGTYMDEFDKPGQCQPCPTHTQTPVAGATSKRLCACVQGYIGPPGGPCTEIKCPTLYAPQNGTISNCNNTLGSACEFGCQDGFVIDSGTAMRTCQENGEWDGVEPHCSACPENTYKKDVRSCMPCPKYSHTEGVGNMKQGCVCDIGFEGPAGGPCNDTDECDTPDQHGPCGDLCENRVGGYKCGCSIPGYKIDEDQHTCIVEKECKNLTTTDAPENGGLVCHYYREEASQQCGVRCNNGYEFPSRVNDYEHCGPSTGYIWSFRRVHKNATIPACIPEFFPGFRSESDVYYFTRDCDQLSNEEKEQVYKEFKKSLDAGGVCKKRSTQVCNIQDMGLVCGIKRTRTKRGVLEEVSQVNLAFNLQSLQIGEDPKKDCPRICAFLRIRRAHCVTSLCVSAYKRFLKAAVMYARQQLQSIYRSQAYRRRMQFAAANRTFEATDRLRTQQVAIQCAPGMRGDAKEGWCVPCESGTRWDPVTKECVLCPPGTYQPFKNETACAPCPIGSTSKEYGAFFCTVCDKGFYGDKCAQKCKCQHGDCHPADGTCTCLTGWQGALCDEDIPGCRDVSCYPGVECIDVPAPGTGFKCGPCPPGYRGDGGKCEPDKNEL